MDQAGIIGICVTIALAMLGFLLSVIGWLLSRHLKIIEDRLKPLVQMQIDLAGMTVKVDQHSAAQQETSRRLAKVEDHVSNTERVALMEQRLTVAEKDIVDLRGFRHGLETHLQTLANLVGTVAMLTKQVEALTKADPAVS